MFTNFLSKQNYHSSVLQKPKYFEWQMLSQKKKKYMWLYKYYCFVCIWIYRYLGDSVLFQIDFVVRFLYKFKRHKLAK